MRLHELEAELRAGRKARRASWPQCMRIGITKSKLGTSWWTKTVDDVCENFSGVGLGDFSATDWELVPEPQQDVCDIAFVSVAKQCADNIAMENPIADRNRRWFRRGWDARGVFEGA